MQVLQSIAATLLLAGASTAGPAQSSSTKRQEFDRYSATLGDFSDYALRVAKSRLASNSTCTAENITVRKSWHNLSGDERIAYTDAVLCLQSNAAKTPSSIAPGAKTRFDDWVVTHINQTYTIHFNANFLGWHRWFVWEHEQALRNECGYAGALPYWDWAATAASGLASSPLFDGSATSLSGNGAPVNYSSADYIVVNAAQGDAAVYMPPGTGGGCITEGPFVNSSLNLGPFGLALINNGVDASMDAYQYNPRCLKRSLTDYANQRFANETSVLTLLREPQDIDTFQTLMSGDPAKPELGVHGGIHWSLGGDPGRDLFVSPGDPAFFLHHGMIDRAWWLWQMQDPATRIEDWTTAVKGPFTMRNETAPFRNGTAEDVIQLGYVAEGKAFQLGELLDPTAGFLCYVYE
ncbi:unnamed protein product [Discula destructiva]